MKKKQVLYKHKNLPAVGFRVLLVLLLAGLFIFLPEQNVYSFRAQTEEYKPVNELMPPSPAALPVNIHSVPIPDVSAQGIVIIDVPSGMSLYEKNPDIEFLPASTTKIMTALVALEDYKLTDEVLVKTTTTEGQTMGLTQGEVMTVENLLYGALVYSANDAAYTLAEYHSGGVDGFVKRMNVKAKELHLTNTQYVNPIGLDNQNHYTTPRDLATLSREALKNTTFAKMVGISQITVSDTSFSHFHTLKNVNELLGKMPGIYGIKTGWTEEAGQALVSVIQKNGRHVLLVLLKSNDRFGETEKLFNWIFATYVWKDIGPAK